MKFPKSNKELDVLFLSGKNPVAQDFVGEQYYVDILTGIPSARRFNHRKLFFKDGDLYHGNNIVFGSYNFGYFNMEQANDAALNVPVLVLNYHQPKTSFLFKNMIDHIVELENKANYLGRYYMQDGDKLKFDGYFSLVNCKNIK